jgi:hypothetical protein
MPIHVFVAACPDLPVSMRAKRSAYAGIESGFERAQPFAGVLGAGPQPLAAQAIRITKSRHSPAVQANCIAQWLRSPAA